MHRQALHKFSDMLRYQLYEANGEKIPIEKEIGCTCRIMFTCNNCEKDENYKVQFNRSQEVKIFQ